MNNGVLYVVTVLIWGSTWLAIEFQLGTVAPEVSVFYRYALAAVLLFGWCYLRRKPMRFPPAAHGRFMLMGLMLFCINYLLAYKAQIFIASALSAIMFSTMVWMNMINARLFFAARSDGRAIAGSLLGVAGLVVIFYPQTSSQSWSDATLFGSMLALAGAFVASLGNMVSQDAQNGGLPIVQSNAWGMAYGAIFTAIIAAASGKSFTFEWTTDYVLSLVYLAVFGSILAFGAFLTLLGRIGAHRVGYAMVLFPVVAIALSALFEDLELTPNLLAGAACVLAGNAFVIRAKKPMAVASEPVDEALEPGSVAVAEAGLSDRSHRARQ